MQPILDKRCPQCGMLTLAEINGKEVCRNSDWIKPCPSRAETRPKLKMFKSAPKIIFDGEICI